MHCRRTAQPNANAQQAIAPARANVLMKSLLTIGAEVPAAVLVQA